jgi:acylphosphatase
MDETIVRVRLSVHGRVQGVGYRAALHREATRLGLAGWVRNRHDGTVEAWVQGRAAPVERLVAWARRGPPLARVAQVLVAMDEAQPAAPAEAFEVWPTV